MDSRPRPHDSRPDPLRPLVLVFQAALAICLLAAAMAPLTAPAKAAAAFVPAAGEFVASAGEFEDEEAFEGEETDLECLEIAAELDPEEAAEFCSEEEDEAEAEEAEPCPLRSASARATTRHNRLKITIGYTTFEPTPAQIKLKSGSHRLGTFKRHLGRSGVLRFTRPARKKLKLVVQIKPLGESGCPSRRLVLFPH